MIAVQEYGESDVICLLEAADLLFQDRSRMGMREDHYPPDSLLLDMAREQSAEVEHGIEAGRTHEVCEVDDEKK